MSRLKHYDGNTVVYESLDHRTKTRRHETCEGEEFIERLTQHIPDKGFRMIRWFSGLPGTRHLIADRLQPAQPARTKHHMKSPFRTC